LENTLGGPLGATVILLLQAGFSELSAFDFFLNALKAEEV
jgi:hypothetical protein